MSPRADPLSELDRALSRAEEQADRGDVARVRSALVQFDLVLRHLRTDDLEEGVARALHARLGSLAARLGESRDQVFAELEVTRRTRAYGSGAPSLGARVEDRA